MIKTSRKWLIYGLHKILVAIVATSYNVIGHTMQHDWKYIGYALRRWKTGRLGVCSGKGVLQRNFLHFPKG